MGESIYVQLEKSRVITPVNGKDYDTPLPEGLFPTAEQFESPDLLIAWADEHNYTAKLIQKGLQKAIIEVRAAFKACPKDKTWTEEMGLENVKSMEWKTVDKPNQKSKDIDKAVLTKAIDEAVLIKGIELVRGMITAGIERDIMLTALNAGFKPAEVQAILEKVESE